MITVARLAKFAKTNPQVLDRINVLVRQLSSRAKLLTAATLSRMLENKNLELWVMRDGEKIIGMGSLVIWRAVVGVRSRIEDIVIDEAYRGKGLGECITKILIRSAKRNKAKDIEFSSRPNRVAANALYRKLGFEKKETNVYTMEL